MADLELLLSLQSEECSLPHVRISDSKNAAAPARDDAPPQQQNSLGYCSDEEPLSSKPLPNMSAFKDVFKTGATLQGCNKNNASHIREEPRKTPVASNPIKRGAGDVEQHSGLGIRSRTIDPGLLRAKLADVRFLRLQALKTAVAGEPMKGAWATIGVLVEKGSPRVSSNGKNYAVWKLSSLDGATVSLFLFGDAYREHWKESIGFIVALFDASVRNDDKRNDFSLSIFDVNQLMIIGTSSDFGICQGKRKDGTACNVPVDMRKGAFCKYHASAARPSVRSKRPELSGGNLGAGFKAQGINPIKRVVEESIAGKPLKRVRHQSASELSKLLSNADKLTTKASSQGLKFLACMAENNELGKEKKPQTTQRISKQEPNMKEKETNKPANTKTRCPLQALSSNSIEMVELELEIEDGLDVATAQAQSIFNKNR